MVFPPFPNLTGFFQGFYIPYEDGAVAQFNDALPSQLVQNAAHGHSAGRYRGGDVLLCTADRAAGGESDSRYRRSAIAPAEGHLVQLSREQAHSSGKIFHHSQGQFWVFFNLLGDQLPVNRHDLTACEGHSRGNSRQLIKKGGLSK